LQKFLEQIAAHQLVSERHHDAFQKGFDPARKPRLVMLLSY